MKLNLWTLFWIGIGFLFLIFGIIRAILQWQKNRFEHDEKMMAKTIELELIKQGSADNKAKKSFPGKAFEFFGKIIREYVQTIAGKMIGGI